MAASVSDNVVQLEGLVHAAELCLELGRYDKAESSARKAYKLAKSSAASSDEHHSLKKRAVQAANRAKGCAEVEALVKAKTGEQQAAAANQAWREVCVCLEALGDLHW